MDKRKTKDDRVREQPMTYDAYAAMPDDGGRYEIVDGNLELMSPGPSRIHQEVSIELEFALLQNCKSDYKIFHAPFDLILSPTDVVQPDILMIHRSRLHILTDRGVEGPPDLVVEIVSPGSRVRDKVTKMKIYAKYGVPEYWIIDAVAQTLERYRLVDETRYDLDHVFEGDDRVASDKIPCATFVLRDIFSEAGPTEVLS